MENTSTTASCWEWSDWSAFAEVQRCVSLWNCRLGFALWSWYAHEMRCLQRIALCQNTLAELGIVPVLVRLITLSDIEAVVSEAINVSIAMLIGGNKLVRPFVPATAFPSVCDQVCLSRFSLQVQRAFYRQFKKSKDSEFLRIVYHRIRAAGAIRKSFMREVRLGWWILESLGL
jgi:hypothetical protein